MDLYTGLTPFAVAFLVLGLAAAAVAVGVLTGLVARHRRTRLARHESIRTYYRGLALSH